MSVPLTVATNGYIQVGGTGPGETIYSKPGETIYSNITGTVSYNAQSEALVSVDVNKLNTTIVKVDLADITVEGAC
jgi:hypothetical protein